MVSMCSSYLYLIHSDISKDVPPVVKKRMGKIYQTGLLTFLAGFAIWNVDNIYCSTLTEWKKAVGWPLLSCSKVWAIF
jgi:dihydroceramidase